MYRLDALIFLSWDVLEFLQGPLHHPGSQASVRGTEWSYRLAVSLHPVGRNVPWTSRPSVGCLVWRALPSLCGFSGSGGRCLLFPLGCLGIRFPFSPNRVASLFTPLWWFSISAGLGLGFCYTSISASLRGLARPLPRGPLRLCASYLGPLRLVLFF